MLASLNWCQGGKKSFTRFEIHAAPIWANVRCAEQLCTKCDKYCIMACFITCRNGWIMNEIVVVAHQASCLPVSRNVRKGSAPRTSMTEVVVKPAPSKYYDMNIKRLQNHIWCVFRELQAGYEVAAPLWL